MLSTLFLFADIEFSHLGNVTDAKSDDVRHNMTGLYNLQVDLPDNSVIRSLCALGVVDTTQYSGSIDGRSVSGRLAFLVVRNSQNGHVIRTVQTLTQDSASTMEVCIYTNLISIRNPNQVSILVAIPSFCVEESDSILCPLQVHFEANNSDARYYRNSDVDVDEFFVDGNTDAITDLLDMSEETAITNTSINVRVGRL